MQSVKEHQQELNFEYWYQEVDAALKALVAGGPLGRRPSPERCAQLHTLKRGLYYTGPRYVRENYKLVQQLFSILGHDYAAGLLESGYAANFDDLAEYEPDVTWGFPPDVTTLIPVLPLYKRLMFWRFCWHPSKSPWF